MSREWKPGEIVSGLLDGNEIVGIVRGGGKRMFYADSVTTDQVDLKHVRNLRPLVVIDPEDREQVACLVELLIDNGWRCTTAHGLRDALREFANPTPPKPAEPTGLGAVVVDRDGSVLVRVDGDSAHPWRASGGHRFSWDDVDHVTTLSAGVEPPADWEIDLLRGAL